MKTGTKKLLSKLLVFVVAIAILPFTDNSNRMYLTFAVLLSYILVDILFIIARYKKEE